MKNYYSNEITEVLNSVESTDNGLTNEEAAKRLAEHGRNELDEGKKRTKLQRFFAQFKDTMIIVLIVAAIVSAVVSLVEKQPAELIDSGIILLIVVVNAIIGMTQESKAEAALDALKSMNKPFSKVLRDGELKQIPSEEIVVGDVVQIDAGDYIPADLRLLSSASLKIEEAALTGESVPSEKDYAIAVKEDAPLGDRLNMAYSSGVATYGRGRGVVVSTGMNTEVGKIAKMLNDKDNEMSPLQKQLGKTAKILSILVLFIAAIIFVASLLRKTPLVEAFMTSVAIAVAAIPEGLPAVVTIVLAIGVQRMSKRNAIVKNLTAVETLGCCEIICSDKTGTLTLNQMTVKELYTVTDGIIVDNDSNSKECEMLIRGMVLCNDSQYDSKNDKFIGDPTETALVIYGKKYGIDIAEMNNQWQRVNEVPFDSIRKLMTTINKNNTTTVAHIKGAPDILLTKCTKVYVNGKVQDMTEEMMTNIMQTNSKMADKALRVLGVAVKEGKLIEGEYENELTFVGLVGMIDPPREEVKEAVKVCIGAGMRPVMITGDHIVTASAIAREIGILRDGDRVMLGVEIDKMSDSEFKEIVSTVAVFARVSPENKVRIVQAYRSMGKVVAMTGDGVNDAPSIKEADIGIGMGITGTDVSKGAADMVLADDNFATIIGAVEEGRKIFSNITKAIRFLLSANIAEVLCLFIATIFLGVPFLTPVMILWVNLVTDSLPALALGTENSERNVMNHPPRSAKSSLFAGSTGKDIIIQGLMQTILVMLVFALGQYNVIKVDHTTAVTMAFVSLCFIQLFHSYNLRSLNGTLFNKSIFSNKMLNYSFLIGVVLIVLVVAIRPIASLFDATPLSITEWAISIGIAFLIIPCVEIQKVIENKIEKIKYNKAK